MKKLIIYLLFTFIFILNVNATTIKEKWISGPNEIKMGETAQVSFFINFSDIDKNSMNTEGIWLVGFDLFFDEDFYTITSIESPGWISTIYKEDNEYAVMSFPAEDYQDKCLDGYLNCGNYTAKINFYVKDSDLEASTIKMGETGAGVFKLKEDANEYLIDDMIMLEDNTNNTLEILIKKDENIKIEEPKSIIQEETPKIEEIKITPPKVTKKVTTTTTTAKTPEQKSKDNTYLKSLEIDGYKIKFKKYYLDYIIYIDEDVNELNINATSEDENATITITGADNLKDNEYKVKIEVKSPNDEIKVYTIKARFKEENKFLTKLKKTLIENKLILYICGGIILLFTIIIIILKTTYNHKLDKALDKF